MLVRSIAILFTLSIAASSWAINPHDEYYADDIFTAIKEAKKRPHHYDYSNAKRYNRSTTQSLDIPRLLNQEMGTASIKSNDANSVSVAEVPLDEQRADKHNGYGEELVDTRAAPIQTAAPQIGNLNVTSPNITTNVIAR
ncbi:hypothetical protein A9R00_10855 [Oleispira antarctica]|uniref:Uncharacterized protein n=1 Tax=Oleispira antarctica TaxID=188908 RepID=A0A1Y5HPS7_OLEAN|nr:hypothetical protein A9R00_10855 [Oleispira antarctica]